MSLDELTDIVSTALGKSRAVITGQTVDWDSLDRLEIITHLHDVLGEKASALEGLNDFNNLDTLAEVLRKDGFVD